MADAILSGLSGLIAGVLNFHFVSGMVMIVIGPS